MRNILKYDDYCDEDEMPTELEIKADEFAQKHYKAPPNYEYYACVCGYIGGAKEYTEKAKEIIADLIDLGKIWLEESDDDYEFIQKAEQFIKENE